MSERWKKHMRWSWLGLLIALIACGDDDGTAAGAAGAPGSDGSGGGSGGGTVTVDDTTYELTRVLDCTVGNAGAPDDRQFVGESDDGSVRFSVSYFGADAGGLNGIGLDTEVDGDEWTWASSYAGADAPFEITLLDDGAEGSATVGVVGLGAPDQEFTATWSFSCQDDRS